MIQLVYAGENAIRNSGDVRQIQNLQMFMQQAADKGNDEIHVLANPSQAEKMFQNYLQRKANLKNEKKQNIVAKYGGAEHLVAPPKLYASEAYAEFREDGTILKGQEEAIPKTKYLEDGTFVDFES